MTRSPSVPIRLPNLMALTVLAALMVACGGGTTPTPAPAYPAGSVVVTARDRHFDTTELHLPANAATSLVLVNEDSDSHNIAIRTKAGFEGDVVFRHDPVSATTIVLTVGPIAAGTYFFICEVHPTMSGTVVVQ